jgi:hypothetical protein
MMRQLLAGVGKLTVLALVGVATVAGDVRAESIPAIAGAAWLPGEATCFSTPSFSNRVTNTACAGSRSWLVPIHVRPSANLEVRASSAGAGAAPQCRTVHRSGTDASVSLGGLVGVGADTLLANHNVNVSSQTIHIDCTLAQNAKGLSAIRWTIN